MTRYEEAVLKTLCYGAVFKFPLTEGEIWKYLIVRGKELSRPRFKKKLKELVFQRRIYRLDKYYLLDKKKEWVSKRMREEREFSAVYPVIERITSLISWVPSVLMVGVSGGMALGLASKDDDIDLFIVTKSNTLYATRLIVWLIFFIAGLVRRPKENSNGSIVCLNMFCDEKHLVLSRAERDIYTAHEVAQLLILYSYFEISEKFRRANGWITKYLPNSLIVNRKVNLRRRLLPAVWLSWLFVLVEPLCFLGEYLYMRRRMTREVVRWGYVRFHPRDAREWIIPAYNKLVTKIIKSSDHRTHFHSG